MPPSAPTINPTWQAQVRIDLDAIEANVRLLRERTRAVAPDGADGAEVMAVVKGDGYGHGMVPAALAALRGGATWLGGCTVGEAMTLRAAGVEAPVLAWLMSPGVPLDGAVAARVDLTASSTDALAEIVAAAGRTGRSARVHLKLDTGLSRNGSRPEDWPVLCEEAAKAAADGAVEVVGVWSHLVHADSPQHPENDRQRAVFEEGLAVAEGCGITPAYRHLANSAATLTRPDMYYDLVRPGIACYGLSPVPDQHFGLRPAMTAQARVVVTRRVPAGQGVSYSHTWTSDAETTLALVPLGYADGVPRAASNRATVFLRGARRPVAGRVCMDQIVVDCGDDPVAPGDVAVLFGPGDGGAPTADDWAQAADTINYEIVTRFGSARVPRVYSGAIARRLAANDLLPPGAVADVERAGDDVERAGDDVESDDDVQEDGLHSGESA
jgi:alanine racemase